MLPPIAVLEGGRVGRFRSCAPFEAARGLKAEDREKGGTLCQGFKGLLFGLVFEPLVWLFDWLLACLVAWLLGCLVAWLLGLLVCWCCSKAFLQPLEDIFVKRNLSMQS